jgi:tetratricopeptide (TPR) repeat protein
MTPDLQCPEPSSDEKQNKETAGKWFGEAEGFVQMGKYAEAVGAYACSYRFVKHPNTLFNMGQAALTAGNDELALSIFEQYLSENADGPFADKCRLRITAIKNRQERWQRQREAEAAEEEPEPPKIDPAMREENQSLKRSLERTQKREQLMRMLGMGLVIGAGTALGMGIGFQVASSKTEDVARDDGITDYSADRLEKARRLQIAATSLFVAAGTACAVGVSLLVLNKRESAGKPTVAISPTGVHLSGTF